MKIYHSLTNILANPPRYTTQAPFERSQQKSDATDSQDRVVACPRTEPMVCCHRRLREHPPICACWLRNSKTLVAAQSLSRCEYTGPRILDPPTSSINEPDEVSGLSKVAYITLSVHFHCCDAYSKSYVEAMIRGHVRSSHWVPIL